jgi:hypothetical protein
LKGTAGIATAIPLPVDWLWPRVGLRTVAELLGHRTLQMVMRYSHLAPEHQASAVERLVSAEKQRDTKSDTGAPEAKRNKKIKLTNARK